MDFSRRIYTRRQWDDFCREWNEAKKEQNRSSNSGTFGFVGSASTIHGCREGVDGKSVHGEKTGASVEKEKKRRRNDGGDNGEILIESSDPHLDCTEKVVKTVDMNMKRMENENIGDCNVSSEDEGDEVDDHELTKDQGNDSCGSLLNEKNDDDYVIFLDKYLPSREIVSPDEDDDDCIWIAREESAHKPGHQKKFVPEKVVKMVDTNMKGMEKENTGDGNVSSEDESVEVYDHELMKDQGDDSCGSLLNEKNDDDYVLFLDKYLPSIEIVSPKEDDDDCIWIAREEIDKQIKKSEEKSIGGGNVSSEDEGDEVYDHELMKDRGNDSCGSLLNDKNDGDYVLFLDKYLASREMVSPEEDDDDFIWIAREETSHKPDHRNNIDKQIKKSTEKNKKLNSAQKSTASSLRSCSVSKFEMKGNVKNHPPASEDGKKSESSFVKTKKDDKCMQNNVHNNDRKEVKRPSKRRRPKDGKGDLNFKKMLLNSVWGDGDFTKNNMRFCRENIPESLPLKFRFEDEDPAPPEINSWDKEVEDLFADLQVGLQELKDSLTTQPLTEDDGINSEENNDDQAVCCEKGKHLLILDEQIGLICKYCCFVHRERKHIMPSFAKRSGGRPSMKFYNESDCLFTDGVALDGGAGSHFTSIHERGTVWEILPQRTKETMYPHQQEGFEFLWRNIGGDIHIENLKKLEGDGGKGCIISHAPGTGKTRLTIMFLMSFMKLFPACRPIIIAPRSMLLAWEDEFRKWEVDVPFHNMNNPAFSGREDFRGLYVTDEPKGRESKRLLKLCSWAKGSGILGISYRLFEQLLRVKEDQEDDKVKKILLKVPGVVVLDEGHTARNNGSLLWNALSKLETPRRIILSGTPFQNNFDELYNTLCLVCPTYVQQRNSGKKKWDRLTSCIGKDRNVDVRELKSIIAPLVHVHKGSILLERLPGLRSTLVYLKPTSLQQKLFCVIPQKKLLEEDNFMTRIAVHPSLMKDVPEFSDYRSEVEGLELDPDAGVKTEFVFALIRLSDLHGEKVIVFSQFIAPMELMKKQLESVFDWVEGREVLYMAGNVEAQHRQACITTFNDPKSEAKVLLASTRACSEGINLVGASRVVLLDVVWNPSVKRQAVSRAYRLGQTKIVHVYHLISSTMEAKKFEWQAKKDFISELVFSTSGRLPSRKPLPVSLSDDKILEAIVQHPKHSRIFDQLVHNPNESDSIDTFDFVE